MCINISRSLVFGEQGFFAKELTSGFTRDLLLTFWRVDLDNDRARFDNEEVVADFSLFNDRCSFIEVFFFEAIDDLSELTFADVSKVLILS